MRGNATGVSSSSPEPEIEARPAREAVAHRYAGAVRPDDLHNTRQAQSGSAGTHPLAAPEALENVRPIIQRYARTAVLILADELVGNLDDENAGKIAALLARACRERGRTFILVTHDRNLIHPVDHVFDMRSGSLTSIERVFAS